MSVSRLIYRLDFLVIVRGVAAERVVTGIAPISHARNDRLSIIREEPRIR